MRVGLGLGLVSLAAALLLSGLASADGPRAPTQPSGRPAGEPAAAAKSSQKSQKSRASERSPLWAQPAKSQDVERRRVIIDRVVAVVGREIITLTSLRRRAAPVERALFNLPVAQQIELSRNAEKDVLEQMIDEILIANVAAKKSITVNESEIDAAVEKVEAQNGLTREGLLKAIADSQWSEEEYRTDLRRQVLRFKVLQAVIVPRTVAKPGISTDEWAKVLDQEFKVWSAEQRIEALVEVRL